MRWKIVIFSVALAAFGGCGDDSNDSVSSDENPGITPTPSSTDTPGGLSDSVCVQFDEFKNGSELSLKGAATAPVDNGIDEHPVLRLVAANDGGNVGSAFALQPCDISSFSTQFSFRLTDSKGTTDNSGERGADGFVFVVQTAGTEISGSGGSLGYSGIQPSLGVEFDIFHNSWDRDTNHIAIDINGDVGSANEVNSVFVPTRFDNGELWTAWIDYDGSWLEVRAALGDERPESALLRYEVDLPTLLGGSTALAGFTGAKEAAQANHDLIGWTMYAAQSCEVVPGSPLPDTDGDGLADTCDPEPLGHCTQFGGLPLVQPSVEIVTLASATCLSCGVENAIAAIDGDIETFALMQGSLDLVGDISLTITNADSVYQPGMRAGFIVARPLSLLNAELLGSIAVSTSIAGGDVLDSGSEETFVTIDLGESLGDDSQVFVGIEATQPYDALKLSFGGLLQLQSELKVFGACAEVPVTNP